MEYKEMTDSRFLIILDEEGDFHHILGGGPWSYIGDVLVVAVYDGHSTVGEMKLDILSIWIRIFGVPVPMMNERVGRELGGLVGKVQNVHADNRGKIWDNFIRVRIEHVMTEPLKRCSYIEEKGKGEKDKDRMRTCQVKYEKVPRFCFYCGRIGHDAKSCLMLEELKAVRFCTEQRASPYR